MTPPPPPPDPRAATPDAETEVRLDGPADLMGTLFPLRRGHGDPTLQRPLDGGPWGDLWRTQRTPAGPATLRLTVEESTQVASCVRVRAWGPGAAWSAGQAGELLGQGDDWAGFDGLLGRLAGEPSDPAAPAASALAAVRRRRRGLRLLRTGIVLESAVAAVLEQKVTGVEARRAWRRLIRQYGEVPPGPAPEGMRVLPDAEGWRSIPDHDWHLAGVGPQRMRTIRRLAAVAPALERTLALGRGGEAVARALCSIPGVGEWTAAEITQRAHGDPDAISVGDYHLAHVVCHWFTGERGEDADMLRLMAPFAGHRQRVVRLITASGVAEERRGPKMTIQDHRAH